jgi:putative transposase
MARLPRFFLPDHPQHVIQRGTNRADIFVTDSDRAFFLHKLSAAAIRYGCSIHAYVLMTNHVHLLVTPAAEDSLPSMMQSVGRSYVGYFNSRYERIGTLWQGRYKAMLIDTDAYFFACMRYVELNPVRAGLVRDPSGFRWSSYRCNALGAHDDLVTAHPVVLALGASLANRCASYRRLFDEPLPEKTIDEIRNATNGCWALGDDAFRDGIQKRIGARPVAPRASGGDRKSTRPDQRCLTPLK